MTLEEFGRAIGYSKDYIWRVETERNRPSFKFLQAVADYFGVEIVTTLEGDGPTPDLFNPSGTRFRHVRVDEKGRAEACLNCGESRVAENWRYCWKCGQALYNFCIAPARHINPPEARHCVTCGQRTFWSLSPNELETMEIAPESDNADKTPVTKAID